MKQLVALLFATAGIFACKSGDKKAPMSQATKDSLTKDSIIKSKDGFAPAPTTSDTANFTTIQWLDSTYLDLGKQKEGKEIEITFRFKNTGSKNLIIESVSAQCGCTIPEKPEKPFTPGEEGIIKAKYNGSGHGETRKEVYIRANTNPQDQTLTFRTELIK